MKTLSPDFAARLNGPATTLATCFRLTRADGTVMGFTDHDRPLVFAGTTYDAATGLATSEAVANAGFAVGGLEVSGALSSAAINEADVEAGLYDGARLEVFLVDWTDPETFHLALSTGTIGEVIRTDGGFRAEVRALTAVLGEASGRLYQHRCDADLGDARCRIDLAQPSRRGTGTVTVARGDRSLTVSGLDGFASGTFDGGRLVWASGANAGRATEVKRHAIAGGVVAVELWQAAAGPVAAGDTFTVTAGCDKRFETCRDRFANTANFRGFPHIPGTDFLVASAAAAGQLTDGAALIA